MSDVRFQALLRQFASYIDLDWSGCDDFDSFQFQFEDLPVSVSYDAEFDSAVVSSRVGRIRPEEDYALSLALLNVNARAESGAAVGLNEADDIVLAQSMRLGRLTPQAFIDALEGFLEQAAQWRVALQSHEASGLRRLEAQADEDGLGSTHPAPSRSDVLRP